MNREKLFKKCQELAISVCSKNQINVELGAGGRTLPGWLSIDNTTSAHIQCDISTIGIPFPDYSISKIYASHFLEHFSYPNPMLFILKECFRSMCSGGILKIAVPNASIYINAYINKDPFPEVIPAYKPAFFHNTHIDSINYIAYMAGEHKHLFDIENLLHIIGEAGFTSVYERPFEDGLDPLYRAPQSIYAHGVKP